jgi:RNA polymerase sigma-70 factor (ECF subfamily)
MGDRKMISFLLSSTEERNHSKVEYLFKKFHSDMIELAKYRFKQAGIPSYSTDAEDAVQNAFVKIVKYIDSINFEASEQEIKAYVLSIVLNEATDIIASYKSFASIDECVDKLSDTSFIDQLKVNDRYEQVARILYKMNEKYKTVLLYRYYDDMSVKEISDLIGISEKAVYARLERGKRVLLEVLNKEK